MLSSFILEADLYCILSFLDPVASSSTNFFVYMLKKSMKRESFGFSNFYGEMFKSTSPTGVSSSDISESEL